MSRISPPPRSPQNPFCDLVAAFRACLYTDSRQFSLGERWGINKWDTHVCDFRRQIYRIAWRTIRVVRIVLSSDLLCQFLAETGWTSENVRLGSGYSNIIKSHRSGGTGPIKKRSDERWPKKISRKKKQKRLLTRMYVTQTCHGAKKIFTLLPCLYKNDNICFKRNIQDYHRKLEHQTSDLNS